MIVPVTQAEIDRAINNAVMLSMEYIMSCYADCDSIMDDKSTRYERLGRYLSSVKDSLIQEIEKQQNRTERIMKGIEKEPMDIFIIDGRRHKKKQSKSA